MSNAKLLARLTRWINRGPPGATNELTRAYGLARADYPIVVFSHLSFVFLLWYIDQPIMAVFNIF